MYSDESREKLIEKLELVDRQNRDRMISGILDLIGVMVALTMILLLAVLLFSLVNWLKQDLRSVFSVVIDSFM